MTSDNATYRAWMLASLDARPVRRKFRDYPKDAALGATDGAMRETVGLDRPSRDAEIRLRHKQAHDEWQLRESGPEPADPYGAVPEPKRVVADFN